jgi:hypothetical protein
VGLPTGQKVVHARKQRGAFATGEETLAREHPQPRLVRQAFEDGIGLLSLYH